MLVASEEGERLRGRGAGQVLPLRVALLAEVEHLRPVAPTRVVGHLDHHREAVLERRPALVVVAEARDAVDAARDAPHGGALVRVPLRTSRRDGAERGGEGGGSIGRSRSAPG